jgi:lipoprotein-anchoring transpeptidase ErfK/SrfK
VIADGQGYVAVKKLLVGMSALVAAFALAACSGGGSTVAAGGESATAPASSSAPATTSTTSAPTTPPVTTSTTPATSSKPAPKTTPKPPPAAKPVSDPSVPCPKVTTGACVDLSAHKAWLLSGGQVTYGPVSMLPGSKKYATPVGTFHVLSREKLHLSKEFDNAKMPNSVFFYPGDAFHTGSLSAYSHGCVHLSSTSSLRFYNTLRIGDTVQVVS